MRRLCLVIAMLAVTATGVAQDVASLAGTIDLRGVLAGHTEQGCSRTMASGSRVAELHLHVGTRGEAELAVDLRTRDVYVSPGDTVPYGAAEVMQSHGRVVLRGQATRIGGALEVRLVEAERASASWMGDGSLPLPSPVRGPFRATMRCTLVRVDVLPAQPVQGESPSSTSLVECRLDAWPDELTGWDRMLFAPGRGVRVQRDDDGVGETLVVRHEP